MPESVRYLLSKGLVAEAERTVGEIEQPALGHALCAEIKGVLKVGPEVAVPTGVTVVELFAAGCAGDHRRSNSLAMMTQIKQCRVSIALPAADRRRNGT